MVTDLDWAWFAGFFEGEGHIALVGANSVSLAINSTDLDVLERARDIAGGTIVRVKKKAEVHHKQQWHWGIGQCEGVETALMEMEPFFGQRRLSRLQEAKKRLRNIRRPGHCKRGHPLKDDNLYVSPKGSHACQQCRKDRERRYLDEGRYEGGYKKKTDE